MSSNKKNIRQSDLLSFFQKTPKRKDSAVEQDIDIEIANRENQGSEHRGSSQKSLNESTPSASRKDRQQKEQPGSDFSATNPLPIILDSDDDNSRGVGFLSCASSSSSRPTKRRRVILSSDDEEKVEENEKDGTPIRGTKPRDRSEKIRKVIVEEGKENTQEESGNMDTKMEVEDELNNTTAKRGNKIKKSPHLSEITHSFIDSFSFDSTFDAQTPVCHHNEEKKAKKSGKVSLPRADDGLPSGERFPHLDYPHLQPENIKDENGRRPSDPNYDPKTLFIPEAFLKQQTPGHQQWWKLKSKHFDTVLFFKVGKFYELYHMDAVIAVENLGLTYMRGKHAHAGFPEVAYGRFSDQLVNRGYRVARVEQTETPGQLAERQKKVTVGQKEKVVRREICRVTTLGTKTYGIMEGTDSREMDGAMEPNSSYLMALVEKRQQMASSVRFGICFVDCSVGLFRLSEFDDDHSQSNLRTLLAHNYPAQLLYEKSAISTSTTVLLDTMLANVPKEALLSKKQFLTAEKTIALLCADNYLGISSTDWPKTLRKMLADQGAIPQPHPDYKLCLSALGAVLWYLQKCLIDVDTISMKKFEQYSPPSICDKRTTREETDSNTLWKDIYMVLDGVSLLNLHILPALNLSGFASNAIKGEKSRMASFSLLNTINRCQTAFGKRLLRRWVSAPSCDREVLLGRQKAIGWMMREEIRTQVGRWAELMKKVPDLDRLFQRVHTIGLKYRADSLNGHPDSRAQMFEAEKYNKRKIRDLLLILDGLEQVQCLMKMFSKTNAEAEEKASPLLMDCLGMNIAEMGEDLKFFKEAFDRESALAQGMILPRPGVDREYDQACQAVEGCKAQLDAYLEKVKKQLKCTNIKFIGTGRNQYQMEIAEAQCRNMPADFNFSSQRKGFKRYTSHDLQKMVAGLADVETKRDSITQEVTRRVFADFDARKNKWATIVQQISTFDCLLSLTLYAIGSAQEMCFPQFDFDTNKPFLAIKRGFYPSLIDTTAKNANVDFNYIPNDCDLGDEKAHTMLLTGPNMGGKSTYMRQIASLVVLAQIGSMVPAQSMRLSPVDRVFCRIGASDRLAMGQSTFYVELAETNKIIRQATCHSLVIIDELGRGTSTHDGTAIAAAVLQHISGQIGCRTLFSTHYHSLCKFVLRHQNIQFAHMACMVENTNLEDPTLESITFLYTLTEGSCNKSYGFYTAKMAGLGVEVVRKAFSASKILMEQTVKGADDGKFGDLRRAAKDGNTSDEKLRQMIKDLI